MKIMLIGVHYCEGKYRATKLVEQMVTSVGHELVATPAEGVTVCVGRLMPYDKPKKPDVLLKAQTMGLPQTDLDALMGVQAAPTAVAETPKKEKRQKPKAKGKRGKKVEVQPEAAAA